VVPQAFPDLDQCDVNCGEHWEMNFILRRKRTNISEEKLIYHKTSFSGRRELSSEGKCTEAGGLHCEKRT